MYNILETVTLSFMLYYYKQNTRIHAFVPRNIIGSHEDKFLEGNVCKISNFFVKEYKPDDRFRCFNTDRQRILTTYLKVGKMYHDDTLIPKKYV